MNNSEHRRSDNVNDDDRFSGTLNMLIENLAATRRGGKQALSVAIDFSLVCVCLWAAYSLRYGYIFSDFASTWHVFLWVSLSTVGVLTSLGVYRWVIRSTNSRLNKQIIKATIVSSGVLVIMLFLFPPERSNPRSLFIIYGALLAPSMIGVRALWKNLFQAGRRGAPVAIFGAGSAGRSLVNLLNIDRKYRPVVFIDDNMSLQDSTIAGLPVLRAGSDDLKSRLDRLEIQHVILAMPSLSSSEFQTKLKEIDSLGVSALTMPSIQELNTGNASPGEIRDVSIKDILGRGEVVPDVHLMGRRVAGKTVLVTGGGGSIGSEICRQVLNLVPKHLIVLDNGEANLYHITEDINSRLVDEEAFKNVKFTPVLGSVTDKVRIARLFRQHQIDTVFHAAAYKHVPIVEAQPDQAVDVNIMGTLKVLECAIAHKSSDFVLISTDKAVRPTNSMGATKRVAELILQSKAAEKTDTRISMVRFGNVLGSSGSVVPKFKKQIQAGGPITLTHQDVTRYFMTIPEASQLVLQASAIAKGGDVFVLDMGEPVRIEQLAVTMVKLYGRKLKRETNNENDIDIVVEGLRPGEKMYEELFINNSHKRTDVDKIFTADEQWLSWSELTPYLDQLKALAAIESKDAIKKTLLMLAFFNEQTEAKNDAGHSLPEKATSNASLDTLASVG